MTRAAIILLCMALLVVANVGCGGSATRVKTEAEAPKTFDPQTVQSETMAFATRFIAATTDTYSDVQLSATSPEEQLAALRRKIASAYGALGCAVEFNPLVGMMDMAIMVRLSRQISEQSWNAELFGEEHSARIVAMLKFEEADVWGLAAQYLTTSQIAELQAICEQWVRDHPERQYAINVGLADIQNAQKSAHKGPGVVGSVFNLVRLDPFSGLDPAVKEVAQSRALAERMFFELRHMPMMLSWQADSLYLQMLATPQSKKFLTDTSKFTESTTRFADTSKRFVETFGQFKTQLPEQQDKLIEQMNQLIATQRQAALEQATTQVSLQRDEIIKQLNEAIATARDAALNQATTQVSLQRDETIKQLNSAVAEQQKLMAGHLQNTMDGSIDRLYQRARSLVLIAAGAILLVLIIYRLIPRARKEPR